MKREYTKPVVELVKFELNEAIAACAIDVTVNLHDKTCAKDKYKDPDLFEGLFTPNSCKEPPVGYCYYTAAEGMTGLFDS